MPSVSIILTTYNAEAYVAETVASVMNQQYRDFELLVVDDGSTDGTLDAVAAFRDPRVRIFRHEHAGAATNRNRGLRVAGGELVAFLDPDDLWTPDKLGSQVQRLKECPEAGAAYSWTVFVDEDGRFLFAQEPVTYEGDVYPQMLMGCFVGSGSNVLARRACLSAVGGFDSGLKTADDWEYLLRFARRWSFALVPRFQVRYRIRPASVSSDIERSRAEGERVLHRAFGAAPDRLQPLRSRATAGVRTYAAFLYLARSVEGAGLGRAGKALRSALSAHPACLTTRRFQHHLLLWLVLHLVPDKRRKAASLGLMRLFGRIQRRRLPALKALLASSLKG